MAIQRIKKAVTPALLILLLCGAAWSVLLYQPLNTPEGLQLASILMLILMAALLGQLPLHPTSYLMLCCIMVLEKFCLRLYLPESFFALFFLIDLTAVLWWQTGHIQKYFTQLAVTATCAVLALILYDFATDVLLDEYYRFARRHALAAGEKALLITAASIAFTLLFAAAIRLLAVFLKRHSERFSLVAKKFSGLWTYVLIFFIITLLFFDLSDKITQFTPVENTAMHIFILFVDAAYLILLFRAASVKEKMHMDENAKNEISAYNAELSTTLDNMQDIRHDVKNLFLTVGSFVAESNNEEMKAFYCKNIVPFLEDTVFKSDLHARLRILEDDRLKSFLYYKITEIIEYGVSVFPEITSPCSLHHSCGDLVRLLGIFMDNAAEEAIHTAGQSIRLKIAEDSDGVSICVANDIRPDTRAEGVIAGTTKKGLGRGRGLLIAKRITEKYDNVILNSYFTETEFVQCLLILKK